MKLAEHSTPLVFPFRQLSFPQDELKKEPAISELVDDIILVSEEEIADGMFFTFNTHHLVIGGAGTIGISAILSGKLTTTSEETVLVLLSGGNVDVSLLTQIASKRYAEKKPALE